MMGGEALRAYPAFIRPLAQWWIPELKRTRAKLGAMKRLIGPTIKQRLAAKGNKASQVPDMLTWNMNNSPPKLVSDIDYQAHNQLIVSAAAIHTTNMQLSHALFDLAAHPECIGPLREEVAAVIASEPAGTITKTSMSKLRKLDSFMKESQRTNPLGLLTFERRVMSDLILSNGIKIPRGNYIGTPTSAIARDPTFWHQPEVFDAFRFERLRGEPGADNKHQFVTTGIDSLYFGHGRHACPGRFFAAYEIKLILIHLIMTYDVKLPDGEARPANIEMNSGVMANPTKTILLRKRV
jgi:cytochrome P450